MQYFLVCRSISEALAVHVELNLLQVLVGDKKDFE